MTATGIAWKIHLVVAGYFLAATATFVTNGDLMEALNRFTFAAANAYIALLIFIIAKERTISDARIAELAAEVNRLSGATRTHNRATGGTWSWRNGYPW